MKLLEEKTEIHIRQNQENPAPHNDQNTWEEAMVGAIKAEIEEGEEIDEQWIRAKMSIAQELEHKQMDTRTEKTKTEISTYLTEFISVFEKEASKQMPERRI